MKNNKKIILFIFIFLVCVSGGYASMGVYLSDQGTDVKDSSGATVSSADLSVRIYDSATGGNLIFEQNFSDAIVDGVWNVMLNDSLNLSFGKKYWKDYYINDDDLDFGGQERLAFYSPLGDILYENYEANLTVNGSVGIGTDSPTHKLNVDGDVNITGNVTASYIKGNGSELSDLNRSIIVNELNDNRTGGDVSFGDKVIFNPTEYIDAGTGVLDLHATTRVDLMDKFLFYSSGTLWLVGDNYYVTFGTGADAKIFYDGSDMIINPRAVGYGNLSLNSSMTVNENLIVEGTTNLSGDTIVEGDLNVTGKSYLGSFEIQNDLIVGNINISGVNNEVGINTTTPTHTLNVYGNTNLSGDTLVEGDLNITGNLNYPTIYCEASDLTDQPFAVAGGQYRINITTTDEGNGISMFTGKNGTNITIVTSGVYHMVLQPQVKAGAGDAGDFHMWLEKDTGSGFSNVAHSNIELKLSSLEEDVIVLATTLSLDEGDVIRAVASVSDNGILLHTQSPAGEPIIPSIIFTMYRVGS